MPPTGHTAGSAQPTRSKAPMNIRKICINAFLTVEFVICGSISAYAGSFVVNDVVVSDPSGSLTDMEFDKTATPRQSWQEHDGNVWVANVDPAAGTWSPPDGKQILIATNAVPIQDTRQGPEWASDNRGDRVLFTGAISGGMQIYQSTYNQQTGQYDVLPVAQSSGTALAHGSHTPGDPHPRLLYTIPAANGKVSQHTYGWREIDNPQTGGTLPSDFIMPEWVDGRSAWVNGQYSYSIVATKTVSALDQVVFYDTGSGITTQLTRTGSSARFPVMWLDPACNCWLLTAILDNAKIGVWEEQSDGRWLLVNQLRPPTQLPYLFKPDYFIWNGASYLAYSTSNQKDGRKQALNDVGEVWVTRVSGQGPFRHRQVNDPSVTHIKDVENLTLTTGVYCYYTEILQDGRRLIHKAATGLH